MGDSRLLYYLEREQSDNWKVYRTADSLDFYSTKYAVWKSLQDLSSNEKENTIQNKIKTKMTDLGLLQRPKPAGSKEKRIYIIRKGKLIPKLRANRDFAT